MDTVLVWKAMWTWLICCTWEYHLCRQTPKMKDSYYMTYLCTVSRVIM